MISILIPTYNYSVFSLANELCKQAIACKVNFELICVDDGSQSEINSENKQINNLDHCRFIESDKNIGLSNNRNYLAELSAYENLLFIDGDSIIPSPDFINRYIQTLKEWDADVIYGGRKHPKSTDANRRLRWKYGVYREDTDAKKRKKNPYKCTLFNNTLIRRETFNKIGFEKSITKYGHEDTLFAYHLLNIEAKIKHIDNPVEHGDVDLNSVFFDKTHKSIQNLKYIYDKQLISNEFVTFLRIYEKIKRLKINYPIAFCYVLLKPFFRFQLTSKHPSIWFFDIFRLSYFCYLNTKK
ncbi:glycosyltransferase [Seonamhaeicola sp. ML3]|uniref:glycosyltransferase family 2 protein n=1 Tax=Seonamhaeicola sp. ML3 TaxID=2937786 RepID=UPI00200C761F|nr:glycosyltransferase [Seonamhaeicola sp. ML3]